MLEQKITVEEFKDPGKAAGLIDRQQGWILRHFTSQIRPDNTTVVIALWEREGRENRIPAPSRPKLSLTYR